MLTRDRIEEALEEAVDQGRVTAKDARKITKDLVDRGRKQTNDVMKDLEQLVGRGRDEIEDRTTGARKAGTQAAKALASGSRSHPRRPYPRREGDGPGMAQADRAGAPRAGPNFPITAYEDLTAAQVQTRLTDPHPGAAAQGARPRASQRQPQVGPQRDRAEALEPGPTPSERAVRR